MDEFALGVPVGDTMRAQDRWMLPAHCQGLLYTPRLLAVMLLLARHVRLTQGTHPQGAPTGAESSTGGAADATTQAAGAVCEGRQARKVCVESSWDLTESQTTQRPPNKAGRSAPAPAGAPAATKPKAEPMDASAASKPVADTREGSAVAAQLSVRAAYCLAHQRARMELARLRQAAAERAPDPIKTLARMLQLCSPDVVVAQHMQQTPVQSQEIMTSRSASAAHRCSTGNVWRVAGSLVVPENLPRMSHMNARAVVQAACELDGDRSTDGGYEGSVQSTDTCCKVPNAQHGTQGRVHFRSSEALKQDAEGSTEGYTKRSNRAANKWQAFSRICCGDTEIRAHDHQGASFRHSWDLVRTLSSVLHCLVTL